MTYWYSFYYSIPRKSWIERSTNFTAEKRFSFSSMTIFSCQLCYLDRIPSFSAYYISAFFFWSYFPKIWQQQKRSKMIVFNHIKNQGKEREFVLIEPDHSTSSCSKQAILVNSIKWSPSGMKCQVFYCQLCKCCWHYPLIFPV